MDVKEVHIRAYCCAGSFVDSRTQLIGEAVGSTCKNTINWKNPSGYGCPYQWCNGNGPNPKHEWTTGAMFNYPEANCCNCGWNGDVGRATVKTSSVCKNRKLITTDKVAFCRYDDPLSRGTQYTTGENCDYQEIAVPAGFQSLTRAAASLACGQA